MAGDLSVVTVEDSECLFLHIFKKIVLQSCKEWNQDGNVATWLKNNNKKKLLEFPAIRRTPLINSYPLLGGSLLLSKVKARSPLHCGRKHL